MNKASENVSRPLLLDEKRHALFVKALHSEFYNRIDELFVQKLAVDVNIFSMEVVHWYNPRQPVSIKSCYTESGYSVLVPEFDFVHIDLDSEDFSESIALIITNVQEVLSRSLSSDSLVQQAVSGNSLDSQLEPENVNEALERFETSFNQLPNDKKDRLNGTWQDILTALTANNYEQLKLATAMQGGGELFGVDENGNVLFKDVGSKPVMYGKDVHDEQVVVYDLDEDELRAIVQYANASEVRNLVATAGYELFDNKSVLGWADEIVLSDDIQQVLDHTNQEYFVYNNWNQSHGTWLGSDFQGGACYARFCGAHISRSYDSRERVEFSSDHPLGRYKDLGAIRLLRVKV